MGSYSIRFLIIGHFFMDGKVAGHHGRAVAHIQEHRSGHAGPGFPLSPLGSGWNSVAMVTDELFYIWLGHAETATNEPNRSRLPFFSIFGHAFRNSHKRTKQMDFSSPGLFDTVSWANQAAAVSAFGIKKKGRREEVKHSSLTWQVPASVSVFRIIHPLLR